jgi:hypothetical protein
LHAADIPKEPAQPMLSFPNELTAIVDILRSFRGTWALAGGWAIDLRLGRITRPHVDVDVAIFRDEQRLLRDTFEDWQFWTAHSGARLPWPRDQVLNLPIHEIHARTPDGAKIELLLNERRGASWVFRRDTSIELPIERAILHAHNIPVLAPEIVLLFKSKAPRQVDEADFSAALPTLGDDSRKWLRSALTLMDSQHPWVEHL